MRGHVRVTVLGSGVLLPDDERRSAAHMVEGAGFSLLMDCGSGTLHGLARLRKGWRSLTHVAVSHFHTDHFGDLAPILWALTHGVPGGRREPLTLLGPPGLSRILHGLAAAHGPTILSPGFPVEVVELEREGSWSDPGGAFRLVTHPARHTPEAVSFRVEGQEGGWSVGYTGDTGPQPALGAFFRGVDLLISECAFPDDQAMDYHLSPSSVAAMARDAEPGVLVLTHAYPGLEPADLPDLLAREGYTGRAVPGYDGLTLEVGVGLPGREAFATER